MVNGIFWFTISMIWFMMGKSETGIILLGISAIMCILEEEREKK